LLCVKDNSEGPEGGDMHVVCCSDTEGHCESQEAKDSDETNESDRYEIGSPG
jgi:hypothetical protein